MKKAIKKFNENLDEVKRVALQGVMPDMLDMSVSDFEAMQAMMRLMGSALKLITKQAEMIDQINNKLDYMIDPK